MHKNRQFLVIVFHQRQTKHIQKGEICWCYPDREFFQWKLICRRSNQIPDLTSDEKCVIWPISISAVAIAKTSLTKKAKKTAVSNSPSSLTNQPTHWLLQEKLENRLPTCFSVNSNPFICLLLFRFFLITGPTLFSITPLVLSFKMRLVQRTQLYHCVGEATFPQLNS